jgi:ComF family protein
MQGYSRRSIVPAFFETWLTPIAYPSTCPVCGAVTEDRRAAWCAACEPLMGRLRDPFCMECHRFLSSSKIECSSAHARTTPGSVFALGVFDHAWRSVIHAYKYHGHKALAEPLGLLLSESLTNGLGAEALVAIPTDIRKRRERGFGHAELLAQVMAERADIPCLSDNLHLTRRIPDQTRLTGQQRVTNLKGALAVRDAAPVVGKTVLVVDDVTTTGATLREAARALDEAGAKTVFSAVIAVNFGNLNDGR